MNENNKTSIKTLAFFAFLSIAFVYGCLGITGVSTFKKVQDEKGLVEVNLSESEIEVISDNSFDSKVKLFNRNNFFFSVSANVTNIYLVNYLIPKGNFYLPVVSRSPPYFI
jgi:hypothetical protein